MVFPQFDLNIRGKFAFVITRLRTHTSSKYADMILQNKYDDFQKYNTASEAILHGGDTVFKMQQYVSLSN